MTTADCESDATLIYEHVQVVLQPSSETLISRHAGLSPSFLIWTWVYVLMYSKGCSASIFSPSRSASGNVRLVLLPCRLHLLLIF